MDNDYMDILGKMVIDQFDPHIFGWIEAFLKTPRKNSWLNPSL